MKKDIKALQRNFILLHTVLQVIITIYVIIHYLAINTNPIILLWLVLCYGVYIIWHILIRLEYYDITWLFNTAKFIVLLICAIFINNDHNFVQGVAIVMFTLYYLEILIIKEPEVPSEKQNVIVLGTLPMLLGFVIHFNIFGLSAASLFLALLFLFNIIGLTYYVSFYIAENLRERDMLLKENKSQYFEKESLKLEKLKYKNLHNMMAEQKHELEIKNEVLGRVSAEMYTQAELLRYISSVLDIEELIGLVTDSIIGAIGVDSCMLVIHDQDSGRQYYNVNTSTNMDLLEEFKESISQGHFKEYFKNNKPYMDSEVDSGAYAFINNRTVGSLIIVPLIRMGGVTYGLLIAEHRATKMFDQDSLNFFKSITSQISIAVNNANIYSKMEDMAIKDGLTGLYNRREMQKLVSDMILSYNDDEPICLALFDIDRFKRVNDTYGHLFGDEAIKAIADVAKKFAKNYSGVAGRYGGEEFVLAFPSKDLELTQSIMEEFHTAIKDIVLIYDHKQEVRINISIGISSYPDLAKDTETLLSRLIMPCTMLRKMAVVN